MRAVARLVSVVCALLLWRASPSSLSCAVDAPPLISIAYADLIAGADVATAIEAGFGYDGLGVLAVHGVPHFDALRRSLLPLSFSFAALKEEEHDKYTHPESFYAFGWSHGKERLQGRPDFAKGSFYANPQYDRPEDDAAVIAKYPAFVHPNIWPEQALPELRGAFRAAGQRMVEVGALLARHIDAYVKRQAPSYEEGRLARIIETSKCAKGRLLHYFPPEQEGGRDGEPDVANWCGWHNDHGSLTALTPAMYLDSTGAEVRAADDAAGLYVRDRHGAVVKVDVPADLRDVILFQIGETAQIHSGGILQATPHAVRGSRTGALSREAFAVFMEPCWGEDMDTPAESEPGDAQTSRAAEALPPGVPTLGSRWQPGIDFGQFTENSLRAYY